MSNINLYLHKINSNTSWGYYRHHFVGQKHSILNILNILLIIGINYECIDMYNSHFLDFFLVVCSKSLIMLFYMSACQSLPLCEGHFTARCLFDLR